MNRQAGMIVLGIATGLILGRSGNSETTERVISVLPVMTPDEPPKRTSRRALLLRGPDLSPDEKVILPPLSPNEQAQLRETQRNPGPMRIGITRMLPEPILVCEPIPTLDGDSRTRPTRGRIDRLPDGSTVWTTAVQSPGAGGLRLHFDARRLSDEVEINLYSGQGERKGPFKRIDMTDPSSFWSPAISTDELFLEIHYQGRETVEAEISIDLVAHFNRDPRSMALPDSDVLGNECLLDYRCATPSAEADAENARRGVAQYDFRNDADGAWYSCTGSLLNDTDERSTIPYFLTADHCISSQTEASSIEAYWDFLSDYCGSPDKACCYSISTLGGTFLASRSASDGSDFSLLRLFEMPAGSRFLFGWIADSEMASHSGTRWFRLHHPEGWPLHYSEGTIDGTPDFSCSSSAFPRFTYSRDLVAGSAGGSSGSSAYVNLGFGPQVIGQLLGRCNPYVDDPCDSRNYRVDGSFYVTYQSIKPWINPPQPPVISGLSPSSGAIDTITTITGVHFSETSVISFNGALAQFAVLSDNQVRATVPASATSGYVGLATPYGTAYAPTGFSVTEPNLAIAFGAQGDVPFVGDFNHDGRSDFGVFRPSKGTYYVDLGRDGWQSGQDLAVGFGIAGDVPFVGDFDGDGFSDFGVFRPSTGWYYVDLGRNGGQAGRYIAAPFGTKGDIPFAGDFDGDGKDEFGVYRPSKGTYYVDFGRNGWHPGEDLAVGFGVSGDVPFVGDFDGDGLSDFGVFRPSTGWYYIDLGRNGGQAGRYMAVPFGAAGDIPFVGDFYGDGRDEFGVFRPSNGYHYVDVGRDGWKSGEDIARPFGRAGDVPFVGKFNGDARFDFGVFRPTSGWYYADLGF